VKQKKRNKEDKKITIKLLAIMTLLHVDKLDVLSLDIHTDTAHIVVHRRSLHLLLVDAPSEIL